MRDKAQLPVKIFLTSTFLAALASSAHGQASFRSLSPAVRPDGYSLDLVSSRGFAVSDDGATIVGYSRDRHTGDSVGAFGTTWSLGPGGAYAASLLPPVDGIGESWQRIPRVATDVSWDGGLVLTAPSNRVWSGAPGHYSSDLGTNVHASFLGGLRWQDTHCRGMSASGEFVASGDWARRFSTATGAAEELPPPPDLTLWDYTENVSISRDGRSMTGMGTTEIYSGYDEFVWRWRDGVGTERLPLNVGGFPRAILADGSVIVSLPNPAGGVQAGRWMLDGSLIETGIPCYDVIADDGSLFASGNQLWTQPTGLTTLEAFLGPGVLPLGYSFRIDSVSANGTYLLLNGIDAATGNQVAGIVAVPAPGVLLPIASVGCVAFCRRRLRAER